MNRKLLVSLCAVFFLCASILRFGVIEYTMYGVLRVKY